MDIVVLQQVGTFLGGASGIVGVTLALSQRRFVKDFFMSRLRLIAEKTIAEDAARDARNQAIAAREEASSWRSSHDAIVARVDAMNVQICSLQLLNSEMISTRIKLDAAIDWIRLLLNHIVSLELRLVSEGSNIHGLACPTVPKLLADRFEVPETTK